MKTNHKTFAILTAGGGVCTIVLAEAANWSLGNVLASAALVLAIIVGTSKTTTA